MAQSILQICKLSSKFQNHPKPRNFYLQIDPFQFPATPIPRNFILQKERAVRLSFTFEGHGDHYVELNCGVVLLLCVESLMAGSTTGVPMSSCLYYTTKAPEFNSTTYAAPSHYTDAMKFYSALSYYTTKAT
ncbi:hypothetical protein DAPPUDRAFT_237648 [Daphnia pulex]|uniref:Uncharacterized protein n=1 Tax=Daphnia pulex TaxID=6669 RepID=E9G5H0_DAPPU|nr:hypothetical protein DAPPUDRAFT_237648 [Daphnia pulex]|eukprot:EFX85207.1 hypothetical protein DAPPUDRAFT_237648 [Daphnia pulex]